MKTAHLFLLTCLVVLVSQIAFAQQTLSGEMVNARIQSKILEDNRIGLDPDRNVKVYLPPGYKAGQRSYPTLYYLHNVFSRPERLLEESGIQDLLETGFAEGTVKEFILVVADFSSPTTGSMYENSSTSGRWLDFIVNELVPYIDDRFRTLKNRGSRAVTGHFMGGRGALRLAMGHPDLFGVVYTMHPVAAGSGYLPRNYIRVDWEKIHRAESFGELEGTGRTQFFTAICQAFLPNPDRPPFYCDFLFEMENGKLVYSPDNARREQQGFHLDEGLDGFAKNLRSLNAIAFDWARFDETQAHVISNRRLSKMLENLGIEHEGEEFRGGPFDSYWGTQGRFYSRVLPFLSKNLVFRMD